MLISSIDIINQYLKWPPDAPGAVGARRGERLSNKAVPTSTLARGLMVLEVAAEVGQLKGATLQEIAGASGQNRSNVYRYLTTLCELGWLERNEDTFRYRIGRKLLQMTSASLSQIDVRRIARSLLQELALETRLTAHLSVRDGASIVYLDRLESDSPIQMRSHPGMTAPCHTTAMGKAILATLPIPNIRAMLPRDLERHTPNSVTSLDALLEELMRVRQFGYATDMEENEDGIACVGAALYRYDDEVIGAISLSGLAQEVTPDRVRLLGPRIVEVAGEISERMGWRPPANRAMVQSVDVAK